MGVDTSQIGAKENLIRVLGHDKPDHVPYAGEEGMVRVTHGIVNRPQGVGGLDSWGAGWGFKDPRIGSYPQVPALKSIDDIKHYRPPDPEAPGLMEGAIEILEKSDREGNLTVAWNAFNLFERSWILLGMENLLCAVLIEPEKLKPLFRMLADIYIVLTHRFAELDIDVMHYGDDWGTQDRLFMNPDNWRELIKPELARMYDAAKEHGMYIFQHTDGCIQDIAGDLVELGCDRIDPCQPLANDLRALKQKYGGKLSFSGAVDSQHVLSLGTPEDVEKEVRLRIDQLGEGGGYFCGPSHHVPFPEENIEAMIRTTKECGKYRYD